MIKRSLVVLILGLIPLAASAQEGTVRYDHSVQFNLPQRGGPEGGPEGGPQRGGGDAGRAEGRRGGGDAGFQGRAGGFAAQIPMGTANSVVLFFNSVESVMRTEAPPEEPAARTEADARMAGFAARIRQASASRSSQETIVAGYANAEDGTFTETRDFMGRTFLVSGALPTYEWRLVAEQSQFLGHMVQKATAMQDSTLIEAWFTPEIPVSAGPGTYQGLPGLILVVSINGGDELYSATSVDLTALKAGAITVPDKGDRLTPEEYEKLVGEKLEEIRTTRGRRGR